MKARKFGGTREMRGGSENFLSKINRKSQEDKVLDWIEVAFRRVCWSALVSMVMKLPFPQ